MAYLTPFEPNLSSLNRVSVTGTTVSVYKIKNPELKSIFIQSVISVSGAVANNFYVRFSSDINPVLTASNGLMVQAGQAMVLTKGFNDLYIQVLATSSVLVATAEWVEGEGGLITVAGSGTSSGGGGSGNASITYNNRDPVNPTDVAQANTFWLNTTTNALWVSENPSGAGWAWVATALTSLPIASATALGGIRVPSTSAVSVSPVTGDLDTSKLVIDGGKDYSGDLAIQNTSSTGGFVLGIGATPSTTLTVRPSAQSFTDIATNLSSVNPTRQNTILLPNGYVVILGTSNTLYAMPINNPNLSRVILNSASIASLYGANYTLLAIGEAKPTDNFVILVLQSSSRAIKFACFTVDGPLDGISADFNISGVTYTRVFAVNTYLTQSGIGSKCAISVLNAVTPATQAQYVNVTFDFNPTNNTFSNIVQQSVVTASDISTFDTVNYDYSNGDLYAILRTNKLYKNGVVVNSSLGVNTQTEDACIINDTGLKVLVGVGDSGNLFRIDLSQPTFPVIIISNTISNGYLGIVGYNTSTGIRAYLIGYTSATVLDTIKVTLYAENLNAKPVFNLPDGLLSVKGAYGIPGQVLRYASDGSLSLSSTPNGNILVSGLPYTSYENQPALPDTILITVGNNNQNVLVPVNGLWQSVLPVASYSLLGICAFSETAFTVSGGLVDIILATNSNAGVVQPDGTTTSIVGGRLTAISQPLTRAQVYAIAKLLFLPGTNVTITADDLALTLTVASTGGSDGVQPTPKSYPTLNINNTTGAFELGTGNTTQLKIATSYSSSVATANLVRDPGDTATDSSGNIYLITGVGNSAVSFASWSNYGSFSQIATGFRTTIADLAPADNGRVFYILASGGAIYIGLLNSSGVIAGTESAQFVPSGSILGYVLLGNATSNKVSNGVWQIAIAFNDNTLGLSPTIGVFNVNVPTTGQITITQGATYRAGGTVVGINYFNSTLYWTVQNIGSTIATIFSTTSNLGSVNITGGNIDDTRIVSNGGVTTVVMSIGNTVFGTVPLGTTPLVFNQITLSPSLSIFSNLEVIVSGNTWFALIYGRNSSNVYSYLQIQNVSSVDFVQGYVKLKGASGVTGNVPSIQSDSTLGWRAVAGLERGNGAPNASTKESDLYIDLNTNFLYHRNPTTGAWAKVIT